MTPDDLYEEYVAGFRARKFSAGLLLAFIDFLEELRVPEADFSGLGEFFDAYPRQEWTAQGKRANTLIVDRGGETLSIRPFYNRAELFFRSEKKRFDYPSCAPHATQAWTDYQPWLNALVTFSSEELRHLRARVVSFVLEALESQDFDPTSVDVEAPLFARILEEFEMTSPRGEPSGAAYQGVVFGFLRADNPHLQVEIRKVRTGSRTIGGVGDVDGWDGARLAISAEVKHYAVAERDVAEFEAFANEIGRRGALGLVVALSFGEGVKPELESKGLKPLDVDDLLRIVELWDPMKQRIAAMSFVYYADHVERNSVLSKRLQSFIKEAKLSPEVVPDSNT